MIPSHIGWLISVSRWIGDKMFAQVNPELPNIWTGAGIVTTIVLLLGIVTLAILVTTAGLTLGKSVREYRADKRRNTTKRSLRSDIQERAASGEPNWNEWVVTLSEFEKEIAKDILLEDLQLLQGQREGVLYDLGEALELSRKAHEKLLSDDHYTRLQSLYILDRIEATVNPEAIRTGIGDAQSEREAAAHILANQSDNEAIDVGLEILFEGNSMTVYGLEGLHQLIDSDPSPALQYLSKERNVEDKILSQVLLVLAESGIPDAIAPIDGVLDATTHDDPLIRERACRVLGGYGWNQEVRDSLDIESLLTDPITQVRVAAYWMVSEWGDKTARRKLAESATREPDEQARVQIARALQGQPKSLSELKALGTFSNKDRSWADIRHVVANHPNPLK